MRMAQLLSFEALARPLRYLEQADRYAAVLAAMPAAQTS
jgi:hypothetical protein